MTEPAVSFVPATTTPAQRASNGAPPPPPQDKAPRAESRGPRPSTPPLEPKPDPIPVGIPSDAGLVRDPETGDLYRPFMLGETELRCAAKIPADIMLDVIATQQRIADKDPQQMSPAEQMESMHLLGSMLSGVVWDEDEEKCRVALRNKRRPIGLDDLSRAVTALWASYNIGAGVGKEQPDS